MEVDHLGLCIYAAQVGLEIMWKKNPVAVIDYITGPRLYVYASFYEWGILNSPVSDVDNNFISSMEKLEPFIHLGVLHLFPHMDWCLK